MGFFDKTRYFRAIFQMLPFGLLAMYFGIDMQVSLPKKKELIEINGVVVKIHVTNEYNENYERYVDVWYLFLLEHTKGYEINLKKDYHLINANFIKGDSITIWINEKTNLIRQFSKRDKMLLKYSRIDYPGILFTLFGLITVIVSIGYIITSPEDME